MRLMNMYQKNKMDRMNSNKARYEDYTEKNKHGRDYH